MVRKLTVAGGKVYLGAVADKFVPTPAFTFLPATEMSPQARGGRSGERDTGASGSVCERPRALRSQTVAPPSAACHPQAAPRWRRTWNENGSRTRQRTARPSPGAGRPPVQRRHAARRRAMLAMSRPILASMSPKAGARSADRRRSRRPGRPAQPADLDRQRAPVLAVDANRRRRAGRRPRLVRAPRSRFGRPGGRRPPRHRSGRGRRGGPNSLSIRGNLSVKSVPCLDQRTTRPAFSGQFRAKL